LVVDLVYSKTMVPTLISVVVGLLPKNGMFYYAVSTIEWDGMIEFIQLMKSSGFVLEIDLLAPEGRILYESVVSEQHKSKCGQTFSGFEWWEK